MSTILIPVEEEVPLSYEDNRKYAVVRKYLVLGNMRAISELENIPYATLCNWKRQPWWANAVAEIRREESIHRGNRLQRVVDESLPIIEDRLKKGDYILNQKTGKMVRKPVSLRDATTAANMLMDKQFKLEEMSTKNETSNDTMQETLQNLAQEFAKFNKKLIKNSAIDIPFAEKESV